MQRYIIKVDNDVIASFWLENDAKAMLHYVGKLYELAENHKIVQMGRSTFDDQIWHMVVKLKQGA